MREINFLATKTIRYEKLLRFFFFVLFKVDGSWKLLCYREIYKRKKEEDINLSLRQEGKLSILGPKDDKSIFDRNLIIKFFRRRGKMRDN